MIYFFQFPRKQANTLTISLGTLAVQTLKLPKCCCNHPGLVKKPQVCRGLILFVHCYGYSTKAGTSNMDRM